MALRCDNRNGYAYALASKGSPETLTIWHDGRVVLSSAANAGIPVAPTADGTFPVYLRCRFQVMQGTNPDGSHYADPVSFVAYFNGGEAVHYFPARLIRLPAEPGLRKAALRGRRGGVAVSQLREPGHRIGLM